MVSTRCITIIGFLFRLQKKKRTKKKNGAKEKVKQNQLLWSGRRDSNPRQPAWKAGTLPAELLPPFRAYFTPNFPACQSRVPAFPKSALELSGLTAGYRLCATADGKTPKTIETVTSSVRLFERFLTSEGRSTSVVEIGPAEIRGFVLHLKHRRCFNDHPYARPQTRGLSPHTVSCYLRSVRAFWS